MQELNPIVLMIAVCVGGGMGFFCGQIPYGAATTRRRHGMALTAMIVSVLCGLLGGCLFALPVALVFTGIIVVMGEAPSVAWDDTNFTPGSRRRAAHGLSNTPAPPAKPYTEIGHLVVCGACQMATNKSEGIPPVCPHCGHQFAVTIPRPKKRQAEDDGFVPLQMVNPTRRRQ